VIVKTESLSVFIPSHVCNMHNSVDNLYSRGRHVAQPYLIL